MIWTSGAALILLCATGCAISPAALDAVREQAVTARATSDAFQRVAPKLTARDPADAGEVQRWTVLHGANLDRTAAGLESLRARLEQ